MVTHGKIHGLRLWLISVAVLFAACGGGGEPGQTDYSGDYFIYLGHNIPWPITLTQTGNTIGFTLSVEALSISGTGEVSGNLLTLTTDNPWPLRLSAEFSADGQSFSGSFSINAADPVQGSVTGTKTAWTTYAGDVTNLPLFIDTQCIELDKISQISRFRSGDGHDYSDDFESCRSMKHYFIPKENVPYKTIKLFSPVDGTVTGTTEEWAGTLWKGTAVGIRPEGHEDFHLVIFHINLTKPLRPGDKLSAGQELGLSEKESGTVSDFAVGVNTPAGFKLVSYFEVMTDSLFAEYVVRGMSSRSEAIITKEERDAQPLTCIGQVFQDSGTINNRVVFN